MFSKANFRVYIKHETSEDADIRSGIIMPFMGARVCVFMNYRALLYKSVELVFAAHFLGGGAIPTSDSTQQNEKN